MRRRSRRDAPQRRGAQANKLAATRKFFQWLLAEGLLAYNPTSALEFPKRPRTLPRNVLTPAEASRLIEATPTEKPRDIRDRALLEVLYATGIRRAELIALTIYDLDRLLAEAHRIELKGESLRKTRQKLTRREQSK